MRNPLTIDLEDYFQVSAFADRMDVVGWESRTSRVEDNTARILELLAAARCQATFFVLGWVAEKHPQVIRAIADAGHELACHSNRHRRVYEMTPQEFREDTRQAKESIENAGGKAVSGYRAPSFSITLETQWAFAILAELGFAYDSSIFPVRHPNYGMPSAPRFPFVINTPAGSLVEFPMATIELGGRRSPVGGGAYLRVLPYWYTRWAIRYINNREGHFACVYLHPWELDPGQPRVRGTLSARLRHYFGLRGAEMKFRRLLQDFEFCTLGSLVEEHRNSECFLELTNRRPADAPDRSPSQPA